MKGATTFVRLTIQKLIDDCWIVAHADGNHGEKHPTVADYQPDGVPFVMASNISEFQLHANGLKFISESRARQLRTGFANDGDVLLTHKGTVGETCVLRGQIDCPFYMLTPQVTLYRVDPNMLNADFLQYAFASHDFQSQLDSLSAQSTRPFVSLTTQRRLSVLIPPLHIQRRIADILGAYDDLIENNSRRIRVLEEMARTQYGDMSDSMLVRAAGDWMRDVSLAESARALGYELRSVGDVCREVRRAVLPQDLPEDTPYFGLEHLPRRSWAMDSWGQGRDASSLKLQVEAGDVLFGKIRPYFHKVAPAPVAGVASSDAVVLVPSRPELRALALCVVSSDAFVSVASATANGAKMPRANWGVLEAFPVAVPPTSVLQQFESRVGAIVDLIRTLLLAQRNLRATRDLLLPRLMSGEIDLRAAEAAVP